GESNVAVRADQDQRIVGDSVTVRGVPITINKGVLVGNNPLVWMDNGKRTQQAAIFLGQWWHGLDTEGEQGEACSPEQVEESNQFTTCGTDTGRIGGTVSGTDTRRVIEVTGKSAASIGDTQLGQDRCIRDDWCCLLLGSILLVEQRSGDHFH